MFIGFRALGLGFRALGLQGRYGVQGKPQPSDPKPAVVALTVESLDGDGDSVVVDS